MLIQRKKAAATYDQQFSNFRAGELARRLGLNLIEGDPNFNLFIRQASVDVMRGPTDKNPVNIQIRMQGEPHGVPIELTYLYRVEKKTGISTITWSTWFDCRMTAFSKQPFPVFEVISRATPAGSIALTQALAPVSTGNPSVDASYSVGTREPAVAQILGQALPNFSTFATAGVHLVGDGNRISYVMQQDTAPLVGSALYYAEAMATQLSDLARRLGG